MFRLLFTLLFVLCNVYNLTFAQDTSYYFNKTFHIDTGIMGSKPTIVLENEYLTLGIISSSKAASFYVRKADAFGNEVWTKHLTIDTVALGITFGSNAIKTQDNNFILVAHRERSPIDKRRYVYLIKFNEEGDTLWTRSHYYEGSVLPHGILQSQDKGFVIYGDIKIDGHVQAFALKTDSLGNELWHNFYELGPDNSNKFFSALELPDGNLLFSGTGHLAEKSWELWLVKTDAQAEELWMQHYGGPRGEAALRVIYIDENRYLTSGGYIKDSTGVIIAMNYMSMVDSMGMPYWEKIHEDGNYYEPQSPIVQFNETEFLRAGTYYEDYPAPSGFAEGLITKFNIDGEVVWDTTLSVLPKEDHYFRDIDLTPDGGFVATGFILSNPTRSWVVKFDSLGRTCSYVGCDSFTVDTTKMVSVQDFLEELMEEEIRIYPNPAKNHITIDWSNNPIFQTGEEDYQIEIYNAAGLLIDSYELKARYDSKLTVSVSAYADGLYIVRLRNDRDLIGYKKFTVLRE